MINQILSSVRTYLHSGITNNGTSNFSRRFDTSDVKQECLIQVWQHIEKHGSENVELSNAWLKSISSGHSANQRKAHLAQKRSIYSEAGSTSRLSMDSDPADAASQGEEVRRLLVYLKLLNSEQRNILKLVFVDGLSFNEIARRLNCESHQVRRQYHGAIKELRHQLV